MKNRLRVAQPHPGHRSSKKERPFPSTVCLPKRASGGRLCCRPVWRTGLGRTAPPSSRTARRQRAQGRLLGGSPWASWRVELHGSSSSAGSWSPKAQWSQTEPGSNIASVTYHHVVLGAGDKTKIMRYSSRMKKAPDPVLSVFHECAYEVANSPR